MCSSDLEMSSWMEAKQRAKGIGEMEEDVLTLDVCPWRRPRRWSLDGADEPVRASSSMGWRKTSKSRAALPWISGLQQVHHGGSVLVRRAPVSCKEREADEIER